MSDQIPQDPPKRASEKSIAYLRNLAETKDTTEFVTELPVAWRAVYQGILAGNNQVAQTDVSKFIDKMKRLPKKTMTRKEWVATNPPIFANSGEDKTVVPNHMHTTSTFANHELEDGMYRNPSTGTIYKVYHTVNGNNIQVAKRLVIRDMGYDMADGCCGEILDGKCERCGYEPKRLFNVKFKYEGRSPLYHLRPMDRLTMDEARELGALYGTCVICGRTLTNELSIELGIGPVCGDREFGGEFEFLVDEAKVKLGMPVNHRNKGDYIDAEVISVTDDPEADLARIQAAKAELLKELEQ